MVSVCSDTCIRSCAYRNYIRFSFPARTKVTQPHIHTHTHAPTEPVHSHFTSVRSAPTARLYLQQSPKR